MLLRGALGRWDVEIATEGDGEVILLAVGLIALFYPLILAAIVMASFMAAWDTHYFLSFVYLGLTAFALPDDSAMPLHSCQC